MLDVFEDTESLTVIHVKQCRKVMETRNSPTSFMIFACSFIHEILISSHEVPLLLKLSPHKLLPEGMEGWALSA